MDLFANRFSGMFGAAHNDTYKRLPMSGALWNNPNSQQSYSAYPVSYTNQQIVWTTGQDAYVGSTYRDVLDKPPPTVLARVFYSAMKWIYNVDAPANQAQAKTQGEKQPIYHLAKY